MTTNPAVTIPAPPGQFPFDVFVSYADEDADWCVDELIRPLEGAQLVVIHQQTFTLGNTKVGSEDDAIQQSRHTIAFLTRAYLTSKWQSFIVDRVLSRGPGARPLIPVLAEEVDLPVRLEGLVPLNFIDPVRREAAIRRLLENLGRSAREAQEAAARAVTRGIKALARLIRTDPYQKALTGPKASFETAAKEIVRIDRFKTLHDDFQTMQGSFKLVIERRRKANLVPAVAPPSPAAPALGEELEEALDALIRDTDLLLLSAEKSELPADQIPWKEPMKRVRERLQAVIEMQEPAKLSQPLEKLQRLLGSEPPQINGKIVAEVERLSLAAVAEDLRAVRDSLSQNTFDPEAQARFAVFAKSVESVPELDKHLQALYRNHNWLQNIDVTLQPLDGKRNPDPWEIADLWEDVGDPVSRLDPTVGVEWVKPLQKSAGLVGEMVAPPPTDPAGIRKLQRRFNDFRTNLNMAFTRADRDLLDLCGRLRKVGDALLQAIKEMQNG
jgi:hypothetical protein